MRRLPLAPTIVFYLLSAALPLRGSDHPKKLTGIWKGETYAKGETRAEFRDGAGAARHHTLELSLGADGSATVTESPDAVSESTAFAHWAASGDTLTLAYEPVAPRPGEVAETPQPMTFAISHGELTPVTWDHKVWKDQGPPKLHRQ